MILEVLGAFGAGLFIAGRISRSLASHPSKVYSVRTRSGVTPAPVGTVTAKGSNPQPGPGMILLNDGSYGKNAGGGGSFTLPPAFGGGTVYASGAAPASADIAPNVASSGAAAVIAGAAPAIAEQPDPLTGFFNHPDVYPVDGVIAGEPELGQHNIDVKQLFHHPLDGTGANTGLSKGGGTPLGGTHLTPTVSLKG